MSAALTAGLALALLAVLLSSILLLAERLLRVQEDQRLEKLVGLLPGTNCGACGQAGCRAFAETLLKGVSAPAGCSVSGAAARQRIALFLNVAVGESVRRVARLACGGDRNAALFLADYQGPPSCAAAVLVDDGGKACAWGCMGLGDCQRSCEFNAIQMSPAGLPVVDEALCTACGACVRACPKDLFRVVPEQQPLWVACSNPLEGNELLQTCKLACTGCERCVREAPDWLQMQGHLPAHRPGAKGTPPRSAIDRCPTGAIVWFDKGRAQVGATAQTPQVLRGSR